MPERRKFFDLYIDSFSMDDIDEIKQGDFIVTLNMEHLQNAQKSVDFASDLKKADWIIADGISIKLLASSLYKGCGFAQKIHKIPGIDLAFELIKRSKRVAFLGSKQKNIDKLEKLFSDKVVFAHHGFFSSDDENLDEEEKIIAEIKKSSADLLLVALGSPRQEKFLAKHAKTLASTTKIGVGGAFDIWSGELKRAPRLMQNLNLEWLFRLFQEPFRIFRIINTVHSFVLFFVSSLFDEG